MSPGYRRQQPADQADRPAVSLILGEKFVVDADQGDRCNFRAVSERDHVVTVDNLLGRWGRGGVSIAAAERKGIACGEPGDRFCSTPMPSHKGKDIMTTPHP